MMTRLENERKHRKKVKIGKYCLCRRRWLRYRYRSTARRELSSSRAEVFFMIDSYGTDGSEKGQKTALIMQATADRVQ